MAEFYVMPAVSPTMEMGELVTWRLDEGATFPSSTVVADIGTDKANMEAEIFEAGVMLKHLVAEGDEVPAGFPIAIVGATVGEDISALLEEFENRRTALSAAPAPTVAPPEATPVAELPTASPVPVAKALVVPPKARGWMGKTLSANFSDPPGDIRVGSVAGRIVASPLAKKVAKDLGIALERVKGTGPGGRILRADVENAPVGGGRRSLPMRPDEVLRNSPMRKTIAKRLLVSHTEIPTFFLTVTFDMGNAVALRAQLKSADVRVSYNDMVVRAVALALRDVPQANASWAAKTITRHGRVDVGVAVALPDGLITPVVRGADNKTLEDIGSETRALAKRAKDGKLDASEYTGATFTVSNLGMMQVEAFTAIINPPESAILAVGALQQEAVVGESGLTTGWRMRATMTCDHRVLDGAVGATYLQALRRYLENPVRLLL
jgi:pyruvate dehydrogenase E2 component (dihydrolipoamide acetyltransferase)